MPSALAAWSVTAAGIVWPIGPGVAVALPGVWRRRVAGGPAPAAACCGPGRRGDRRGRCRRRVRFRRRPAQRRRSRPPRCAPIRQHVVGDGDTGESPRPLSNGRLMFRAALDRLGDDDSSGQVLVFASAAGFGDLIAGQPVRFRARVGRPTRRDLTVAVLTAVGEPARGRGVLQRAAQAVRARGSPPRPEGCCRPIRPRSCPGWCSGTPRRSPRDGRAVPDRRADSSDRGVGANVTIVCGAVLLCARVIGPRPAVTVAAAALVLFVVVVQPSASVLRAAVMGAIALLAVLSGRRRQAIRCCRPASSR